MHSFGGALAHSPTGGSLMQPETSDNANMVELMMQLEDQKGQIEELQKSVKLTEVGAPLIAATPLKVTTEQPNFDAIEKQLAKTETALA